MPKLKLDHATVKSIKPTGSSIDYYDEIESGLILRVTKTGRKTFSYRYRFDGKNRRFTIGRFPHITLSEARKQVGVLRVKIRNGIDPQAELQKKKYQPKKVTFGELVKIFQEQHLTTLKPSTVKEYKRIIESELLGTHKWKNIPISDITAQHVREVLNKKAYDDGSYTMANRIRSVISKIFEFGLKRVGLDIDRNPVDSTAPFDKGENVRERVYSVDEIRELWEYWETRPEPVQSVYKVLLLTGQRLSEVLHMKWKYIEVDRPCKRIRFDEEGRAVPEAFLANVWTIPDTKNNEIHELPLSNMAFGIIQDLKPATGDSDYVFESPRKKGAPLNSLNSTDKMIKKHTSVSDFRIHDLRRTFATRTEESGIDYSIIKKVLNHKDGDVTSRHYTWYDFMDRKLDAMNRWAWRLQSIVEGKEETKIFSIKHGL